MIYIGDIVRFGSYVQDTTHNKIPIYWRTLDVKNGKALVISKHVLDCMPYSHYQYEEINWKGSEPKIWLNSTFINTAFNAQERSVISSKINSTGFNFSRLLHSEYSYEKIFLLDRVQAENYFCSNKDRVSTPTSYAHSQGMAVNDNCYWLRTSDSLDPFVYIVNNIGEIERCYNPSFEYGGIRPAMWLKASYFS